MPKTKGSRKQKICTSSSTELEDISEEVIENPLERSNIKSCMEEFEMQFAFRLEQFDKLLEEKLASLNRQKEKLKIKHSTLCSSTLDADTVIDLLIDKENINITEVESYTRKKGAEKGNVTSSLQGPSAKQFPGMSKQKNKEQALVPYSGNAFQTPANATGLPSLPTITPKIPLNTPLSILRLPRQGELGISLSGSPVMVTAMSHESKPNINVPLHNRQVLTLVPQGHVDPNSLPELDDEAVQQLEALNRNLMAFINLSSK